MGQSFMETQGESLISTWGGMLRCKVKFKDRGGGKKELKSTSVGEVLENWMKVFLPGDA